MLNDWREMSEKCRNSLFLVPSVPRGIKWNSNCSVLLYTMRCTYILELSSLTDSVRGGNFLIAVQVAKSSLPNYYHLVFSLQQL